jgi:hypothetical protein
MPSSPPLTGARRAPPRAAQDDAIADVEAGEPRVLGADDDAARGDAAQRVGARGARYANETRFTVVLHATNRARTG